MAFITYETAKRYLDKGLSVFPVILSKDEKGKIQKRPAVAWKQFITRLPTQEELLEWFGPDAEKKYNGIGMATGEVSGLNVLDIEGYADEEVVKKFTSPLMTRTISDGWHLFYKWEHEIHNSVKIEGEAVDFRGDGGFVVLPPSNIDGRKYTWATEKADFGLLQPLPKQIEDALTVEKTGVLQPLMDQDGVYPKAMPGERNMVAAKVAGSMATQIPPKLWELAGWPGFQEWNTYNPEPLSDFELRQVWESITNTEKYKKKTEDYYEIFEGRKALDEYEKLQEEFGGGIPTGFKEVDSYFTFLPQQLYLFSAPTHVGKTTFTLNMAGKIASQGYRVLFVSLEQGVYIAPRVESMLKEPFPEDLHIMTCSKMASAESMIEKVNSLERKPDIIFIDHLHFMKKTGGNLTEGIDNMIISIQNMAKELRIPVVVITHVRKLNDNRRPTMDDLRDSSSLQQVPSVVVMLHRPTLPRELMDKYDSYLDPYTDMIIAKNRIGGKAGGLNFILNKDGSVEFITREQAKDHVEEINDAMQVQVKEESKQKLDVGKTFSKNKSLYTQQSYIQPYND